MKITPSFVLSVAAAILLPAAVAAAQPPSPLTPEQQERFCGEYFRPSGARISVYRTGVVAELARLTFLDWESGRAGALTRAGGDTFWAAPSPAKAQERQTVLVFARNAAGAVTGLTMAEAGGAPASAERTLIFLSETVEFPSGTVPLAGTLKRPLGPGPHPAVVLVHGSGPGTREQMESMSRFFAGLGIAALSYDKRGCGRSGGDWKTVDLEALAGDALAAVEWLQSQPGIDPARVGIWGVSQGGWIGPLAAARSDQVAFVINLSGPGTSLRRQDTFMMENLLRAQGLPQPDIALALRAMNAIYDYGRGRVKAARLDAVIDSAKTRPGLEDFAAFGSRTMVADSLYAHQPIGDPAWFLHLDPDRDALAPYRALRCPVLVVYGGLDISVPVQESVAAITATLEESGHPDFQVEVLERSGHGPVVMDPQQPQSPAEPLRADLQYYALLEGWLRDRGFVGE